MSPLSEIALLGCQSQDHGVEKLKHDGHWAQHLYPLNFNTRKLLKGAPSTYLLILNQVKPSIISTAAPAQPKFGRSHSPSLRASAPIPTQVPYTKDLSQWQTLLALSVALLAFFSSFKGSFPPTPIQQIAPLFESASLLTATA